jgi:Glucodextranase, domain B
MASFLLSLPCMQASLADLVAPPLRRQRAAARAASACCAATPAIALAAFAALAGCDSPYADDLAVDPDAPVVRIASPERGAYLGDVSSVTVRGTVRDKSALRAVTVNGVAVTVDPDGAFELSLPVPPTGTTLLTAEATDVDGNVGRETHAIAAGPRVAFAAPIRDAFTAAISDRAFLAIGDAAASLLASADLGAWVAPLNPVVDAGAPDGPDCLYGTAAVGALDVGTAAIELVPTATGLELVAELGDVVVPAHLAYAALCIDGDRDVAMTAAKVRISGRFVLAVKDGHFDFRLVSPQVAFEGFHLDLGGVPGRVVELLRLDRALGALLATAVEKFAAPVLGDALASFDGTTSADVLGKTVDFALQPLQIAMSPVDARLRLDTSFRVRGDEVGPGFVYLPAAPPQLDAGRGLQVAVAAGAVNQLLASFWAAGGMELRLDLTTGDYGGLGKLYDHVDVKALLPLSLRAEGGRVAVVVPELVVTFKNGDQVATEIALNGEIELAVERGGDGALRLTAAAPKVLVDILRDGVDGSNPLASAQFEALTSFALARLSNVAAALLGSVPLPSGPGADVKSLTVTGRDGYLFVDSVVQ